MKFIENNKIEIVDANLSFYSTFPEPLSDLLKEVHDDSGESELLDCSLMPSDNNFSTLRDIVSVV